MTDWKILIVSEIRESEEISENFENSLYRKGYTLSTQFKHPLKLLLVLIYIPNVTLPYSSTSDTPFLSVV